MKNTNANTRIESKLFAPLQAFNNQTLDLDRRVVFIHGALPSSKLPASVASIGPIPAGVTLPIACGRIERVKR